MASSKKRSGGEGLVKPGVLLAVRWACGLAMVLAGYLAWISLSSMNAVGCGPDSGCQEVLNSKWAYFLGIPVSLIGLLPYAALMAGTFQLQKKVAPDRQRAAWLWVFPAAVLAAGGALWFTGVQMFIIKQFCPYCLVTHGLALLGSLLLIVHAPLRQPPEKPWQKEKQIYMPVRKGLQTALGALAALAVLAVGQTLSEKQRYVEKSLAEGPKVETVPIGPTETPSGTNAPAKTVAGSSQEKNPPGPTEPAAVPQPASNENADGTTQPARILSLYEGNVSLNLNEVPLYGRPDADHIMLAMHDYTCKHCRTAHKPLKFLHEQFSNELAIVSLPMPLDANCNQLVPRTPSAHANACQDASMALAVWRAKPSALMAFEDYLFEPDKPPPVSQAMERAAQLVGEQAFIQAMQDPWVPRQLQQGIGLYTLNYQKYRQGSMPQFIIGTNVVFGFPEKEFMHKVTNQFGLVLPAQP